MIITKRDRRRGAMVGVLCGDAVGAAYEWKRSAEICADIERRGGLVPPEYVPFDYIEPWKKKRVVLKGHPTDDSELAAALAQSLIAHPEFNAEDLYDRLRSFIYGRKSILSEEAYGTGSTLRAALEPLTYAESCAKFKRGEIPVVPSNGSLMRCAPVALGCKNIYDCIAVADLQSTVTHTHILARGACSTYATVVYFVLRERSPRDAWAMAQAVFDEHDDFRVTKPTDDDIWPEPPAGPGSVMVSFQAALWASINAESFADGIIKVISLGGDTDTYGAIAGGILGAHFGIQGIPGAWLEVLQGREIMIDLADKLHDIACS